MVDTYDGALGTTINVLPTGASRTVGVDSTLVLVGEGDGGSADTGTVVQLNDRDDAEEAFGEESDLVGEYVAAEANGASDVWGVGLPSDTTDDDVEDAVHAAMEVDPRFVYLGEDDHALKGAAHDVVAERAVDLEFARLITPVSDEVTSSDIISYEPTNESHRLIEVAPKWATVDGHEVYTAAAFAGHAARKELGNSVAYDDLAVDSLMTEYRPSEATDFEQVTAVTKDGTVVDGRTTSDEEQFSNIFQMEIVDTAALGLDDIAQEYAGDAVQTNEQRDALASDMRMFLNSLAEQSPPLLYDALGGDPYSVETELGDDAEETVVNVGVTPVDVMKQITINLNVGRIVTFGGVEA